MIAGTRLATSPEQMVLLCLVYVIPRPQMRSECIFFYSITLLSLCRHWRSASSLLLYSGCGFAFFSDFLTTFVPLCLVIVC